MQGTSGLTRLWWCSNLRLLEEAGADLVFFSPIEDCLPVNLAGLYLGGGYPEKYAQELSKNRMLLVAVKAFAEAGGVVYAECGGLIYLSQSIQPLQEPPASMGEHCVCESILSSIVAPMMRHKSGQF